MVVRLKDIAAELGVSVPLVSKVLNNSQGTIGVSEKTAQKIRDTASRMGYVRNRSAASLTQGRQNAFALLMHFTGLPGSRNPEDSMEGVSTAAEKYDQHLELAFFNNDQGFADALDKMNSSSVDGLILAGAAHKSLTDKVVAAREDGLPIVSIYSTPLHESIPNVCCKAIEIGRVATNHLIECGCRNIACISMLPERLDGYKAALQQADIAYADELVYHSNSTLSRKFGEGLEAIESLLARGRTFDGLVTHSDLHAAAALHVLKKQGISVPQQVKVIGVDNSIFAREADPQLTSISENFRYQSIAAVDMLMDLIGGKDVESLTVAPEVIRRQSA